MAERGIDYVRLDEVTLAETNPKDHDQPGISRSIGHFGFVEVPVRDERSGRLVAGHGRHEQLQALHAAGATPPDGVVVDGDGMWRMPVITGWASRSDTDAEAYLVASNQLTTAGGWNDSLTGVLQGLAEADMLDLTGFTDNDLAGLLDEVNTNRVELPALTDPDDAPEPPRTPRSVPGDVWHLGPHRLLCGDSTDIDAVETMLGGDRCDLMWTDPPYGVDYVGKTADALTIRNDGNAGLPDLLAGAFAVATAALLPGAPFYIAHPVGEISHTFATQILQAGWLWRQTLVWVKDQFVLGRSDYHYQHEGIFYGFTPGGQGRLGRGGDRWYGDNAQSTVLQVRKPQRNAVHPTMKPVELITACLGNSARPGSLIYEPFGGSGSTLMAAQQVGAHARVVELDPVYVDVICRRWQEHTGHRPVHAATATEVDFTAEVDGG